MSPPNKFFSIQKIFPSLRVRGENNGTVVLKKEYYYSNIIVFYLLLLYSSLISRPDLGGTFYETSSYTFDKQGIFSLSYSFK